MIFMLKITTMDAGPGAATYLTHATGCATVRDERVAAVEAAAVLGDAAGYYQAASAMGEAQGVWRGMGLEILGFTEGDKADDDAVHAILALKHPKTGAQLGQALATYKTREQKLREQLRAHPDATEEEVRQFANAIKAKDRKCVAFYDLTYSADKETSMLYAAAVASGNFALAKKVLDAHNRAVVKAQEYLEAEASWHRRGGHRQVDGVSVGRFERAAGQVELHFQHTTSRANDPHLHTHVAIPNRAFGQDGKWRALHAMAWNQVKAGAAMIYERELHAEIERTTPARYVTRADGVGRLIAGIPLQMVEESSQRTQQTLEAQAEAVNDFVRRNNRQPTRDELRRIHRLAGMESRAPKSDKAPAQQVFEWADRPAIDAAQILAGIELGGQQVEWDRFDAPQVDDEQIVRQAVDLLQSRSSTWKVRELDALIANLLPPQEAHRSTVLAEAAVQPGGTFDVVNVGRRDPVPAPVVWQHADSGNSIFRDPALGPGMFVLASHLSLEERLAAQGREHTVTPASPEQLAEVEAEWDAEFAATGKGLNADQRAAVLGILASKQAADQIVAAAGTGKSFTAGKLVRAWTKIRGGSVYGVATSQVAADVLAEEGMVALNATRFLDAVRPNDKGQVALTLTSDDLVVFDEANMTDMSQLDAVLTQARKVGAKVVFQGDPFQLDAVGVGGGLDWLHGENGAFELLEVMRFTNEWEKDASARIRVGDVTALDLYEQHGRVREGTAEEMLGLAATNYVADLLDGRTSALIVGTNDEASTASAAVQQLLMRYGSVDVNNPFEHRVSEGNVCYVGDRLQARKNAYDEDASDQAPITNREFLQVVGSDSTGKVVVRRESNGAVIRLSPEYVEQHTVLGYAGTEHAVEGVSVDTGHALTPGYVAMTRGKSSNVCYVTTQAPGDHHEQRVDTTARQVMERHLRGDDREKAAMLQWREEIEAERSVAQLGHLLDMTSQRVAMYRHTDAILDVLGPDLADRVQMENGLRGLLQSMRRADMDGHDAVAALREAADQRELGSSDDMAAVLRWRLDKLADRRAPERAPSSWSDRVENVVDRAGTRGEFVAEVAHRLDARIRQLGEEIARDLPEWAEKLIGPLPAAADVLQRAEWERRAGTIAAYRLQYQVPETAVSIGARPHEADVMKSLAWRDAARASRRMVDELDYVHQTDEQLRSLVARWERALSVAPAYVADQRANAYQQLQDLDAAVSLARAEAAHARTPEDLEAAQAKTVKAYALAEQARAAVKAYDEAQHAREQWEQAVEEPRDAADRATQELALRGKDETEQDVDATAPSKDEPDVDREPQQLALPIEITTDIEMDGRETDAEQDVSAEAEVDAEPQRRTWVDAAAEAEAAGQLALFDPPRDYRAEIAHDLVVADPRRVGDGLEPETRHGKAREHLTMRDLRILAEHARHMLNRDAARKAAKQQTQQAEAQRLVEQAILEEEARQARERQTEQHVGRDDEIELHLF